MKLPDLSRAKGLVAIGKTFVAARRPEILFGASVTATVASVVLAAKGGYEARGIIDAETERRFKEEKSRPLTKQEMFNLTWHCYTPAALTTLGALGSTTGLHLVHVKEKKAIATTALAAIEEVKSQAKQYADDLAESIQENVELTDEQKEAVQNSLNEKNADRNGGVGLIQNTDGEIEELYLVRDAYSGRDIWSNQHRIEDAIIESNNILNGSDGVDLNFFYNQAGFASLPHGNTIGWSGALITLEWKETKRDDGRPVREFTFRPPPSKGYDDAHR